MVLFAPIMGSLFTIHCRLSCTPKGRANGVMLLVSVIALPGQASAGAVCNTFTVRHEVAQA